MIEFKHMDSAVDRSILVTDSGLGGLSVFNQIANQLEQYSPWESVRLVYFNAWPAPHRGYNHFDTPEKKVRVFSNALYSMLEFKPDQILIACNTLSVIYPDTEFSRLSDTPAEGIVDHGVNMLYEKLSADPGSVAVILGTPTTIEAKSHETGLIRMGIAPDRIINLGCTNLAGWIEREPFSGEVKAMIQTFVKQLAERLAGFTGDIYAGLCCTHFGYKEALFQQAFDEHINTRVTFLNPNNRMAENVFASIGEQIFSAPRIHRQIVSKAVWSKEQINAYVRLMPDMSDTTKDALTSYTLNEQLFSAD